MTILALLGDSPTVSKRYRVMLINEDDRRLLKIIDFASLFHENFTMHKDKERRRRYWKRHTGLSRERINDPMTAAFWSAQLLWTDPTIEEAKKRIERKFDIKFI